MSQSIAKTVKKRFICIAITAENAKDVPKNLIITVFFSITALAKKTILAFSDFY